MIETNIDLSKLAAMRARGDSLHVRTDAVSHWIVVAGVGYPISTRLKEQMAYLSHD